MFIIFYVLWYPITCYNICVYNSYPFITHESNRAISHGCKPKKYRGFWFAPHATCFWRCQDVRSVYVRYQRKFLKETYELRNHSISSLSIIASFRHYITSIIASLQSRHHLRQSFISRQLNWIQCFALASNHCHSIMHLLARDSMVNYPNL